MLGLLRVIMSKKEIIVDENFVDLFRIISRFFTESVRDTWLPVESVIRYVTITPITIRKANVHKISIVLDLGLIFYFFLELASCSLFSFISRVLNGMVLFCCKFTKPDRLVLFATIDY